MECLTNAGPPELWSGRRALFWDSKDENLTSYLAFSDSLPWLGALGSVITDWRWGKPQVS